MQAICSPPENCRPNRRGAALILIVSMLFVFAIAAAMTIDYAYIQLVRAELRVATDAAAKAGAEALARTDNSDTAVEEALRYAALNQVAGTGLELAPEDIVLGRVAAGNNGRWQFTAGGSPFNSVRVNGQAEPSLFFGRLLGRETFSPRHTAVAGQQQIDVCLCLDRSGSMLFDMSGAEFVYPPNNPYLISFTGWGETWRYHLSPPHPTASRWAVLARAVQDFLNEVQSATPPPVMSLVTWGSNYTMPRTPGTVFYAATQDTTLSQGGSFNAQRTLITNRINQLGSQPMMGSTNLSAGLDLAVQHVTGPQARAFSNKVVILLTDGEWNDGRNPLLAAEDARNAGVTVHTVTMLTQYQPIVEQVAHTTGGLAYTTNNEAQLRAAFREIARSLQIVMIE